MSGRIDGVITAMNTRGAPPIPRMPRRELLSRGFGAEHWFAHIRGCSPKPGVRSIGQRRPLPHVPAIVARDIVASNDVAAEVRFLRATDPVSPAESKRSARRKKEASDVSGHWGRERPLCFTTAARANDYLESYE
jgi:hypothetical protein